MHRSWWTDGRTGRRARNETLTRPRGEGGAGPTATATETAQTRRADGWRATATRRGTPRERGRRATTGEDNRKNPNCRKRRQRGGAKAPRYPLRLERGCRGRDCACATRRRRSPGSGTARARRRPAHIFTSHPAAPSLGGPTSAVWGGLRCGFVLGWTSWPLLCYFFF